MAKKDEQRAKNEQFIQNLRNEEGIKELPGGTLYKIISNGNGTHTPKPTSVVTVHYRGTLINGREFDNSRKRG